MDPNKRPLTQKELDDIAKQIMEESSDSDIEDSEESEEANESIADDQEDDEIDCTISDESDNELENFDTFTSKSSARVFGKDGYVWYAQPFYAKVTRTSKKI